MNEAYRNSNKAIAAKVMASPDMTTMYRELAKYGEKHPQLWRDIAMEIVAHYKSTFPAITPSDLLTTATQYVDEYAQFTPERRHVAMNKTRIRDPICYAIMQLVIDSRSKKNAEKEALELEQPELSKPKRKPAKVKR